jgi:hypothetical protein
VEGFNSAKETVAFVERLPKTEGKKAILLCTYALWKGRTFGVLRSLHLHPRTCGGVLCSMFSYF